MRQQYGRDGSVPILSLEILSLKLHVLQSSLAVAMPSFLILESSVSSPAPQRRMAGRRLAVPRETRRRHLQDLACPALGFPLRRVCNLNIRTLHLRSPPVPVPVAGEVHLPVPGGIWAYLVSACTRPYLSLSEFCSSHVLAGVPPARQPRTRRDHERAPGTRRSRPRSRPRSRRGLKSALCSSVETRRQPKGNGRSSASSRFSYSSERRFSSTGGTFGGITRARESEEWNGTEALWSSEFKLSLFLSYWANFNDLPELLSYVPLVMALIL